MDEKSNVGRVRLMSLCLLISSMAVFLIFWQPSIAQAALNRKMANNVTPADTPFGVASHLPPTIGQPPQVATLGVSWARLDISWADVEQTQGQYTFTKFDPFMQQLAQTGINPLVILDYQNPLYDSGYTPYDTAGYTAFANYSKAVLNHYGSQIKFVEVWNEPNGGWFDSGPCKQMLAGQTRAEQTPSCYEQLLQYTYQAVKSIRPDVTVVGGVLYQVDATYLEAVFKAGGLQYMDVISDHPYSSSPEAGAVDQQEISLENLIKQYNNGNPKPIWITEVGWQSSSTDQQTQADYLVRSAVLALSAGVQKYFWYDFYPDDGTFGLLNAPDASGQYTPKPAFTAYKVLTQQLNNLTFVRSEAIGSGIYDRLFTNNTRILWSTGGSQLITLLTSHQLTITAMNGTQQLITPTNGMVSLTLSADPIYVQGVVDQVVSTTSGSDGTIFGQQNAPPSSINLSAEGRSDWADWGSNSATSFDRKSSGNSQISNYTLIGNGSVSKSGGGGATLSWTDGSPDTNGTNAGSGVYIAGAHNGFQITVPADTTRRAVRVYINVWHSTGQLVATLSDGSGFYLDSSISNASNTKAGVYTLIYKANTANQTLTIKWTTQTDFGGGGVVLQAVTLGPAFSTGFENSDLQPTWTSSVDVASYPAGGMVNITGVCCGLNEPEMLVGNGAPLPPHTGSYTLLYSGSGTSNNSADHAYMKVFDLSGQNLVVGPSTSLIYWINPQSAANSYNYASGSNSTCVAIDLIFSDGTNLRDSGLLDQNGNRAHPGYQCNHLMLDTWNQVIVNLGSWGNGKTIIRMDVGYDQANVTGGYRGNIDDISIID